MPINSLYNGETRFPTETELEYYEQSIRLAAEENGMDFQSYMQYTIDANKELNENYEIKDWKDFSKIHFSWCCKYHFQAAYNYSENIIKDEKALQLIAYNSERFVGIFGKTQISHHELKTKLYEYLINSPLFLNFTSDYNAMVHYSKNPENRGVYLNMGVMDKLMSVSKLLMEVNTIAVDDRIIVHDNHGNYTMHLMGQGAYTRLLERNGYLKNGSFFNPKLSKSQHFVASFISLFGSCWVLSHEYSHLVFGNVINVLKKNNPETDISNNFLECLCDELAHRTMLRVEDDKAVIGTKLALYILFHENEDEFESVEESSHPSVLWRLGKFNEVCNELRPNGYSFERLLEIPHRHLQERYYFRATTKLIKKRVRYFFEQDELFSPLRTLPEYELILTKLSDRGFSLPHTTSNLKSTFQKDNNGEICQVIKVHTIAITEIFNGTIHHVNLQINHFQLGFHILMLIFLIKEGHFVDIDKTSCLVFGLLQQNDTLSIKDIIDDLENKSINVAKNEIIQSIKNLINMNIVDFVSGSDELLKISDFKMTINLDNKN